MKDILLGTLMVIASIAMLVVFSVGGEILWILTKLAAYGVIYGIVSMFQ